MTEQTVPMNPISCRRCKEKKIRCSKTLPQCGKCVQGGVDCEYAPRATRPKGQRAQAASLDDTVSDILQRLSSVEEHIASINREFSLESVPSPHRTQTANTTARTARVLNHDILESLGLTNPSFSVVVLDAIAKARDALQTHVSQLWSPREYELNEMLNGFPHVAKLCRMMQAVEPCDDIKISEETAVRWVNLYFENFRSLDTQLPIDEQLMSKLPLVSGLAYVHIDASALIIYHHVIFRGMLLDATLCHQRREISTSLYRSTIRLLEHWQREAGERPIDFQAAYLLSWLAADFFNYDLSWDCFRRACSIGRQLGIFTVDAEHMEGSDAPGDYSSTSTDCTLTKSQKRYAFWQLLQTDCLFRQLFGKSPVIPFGSWCVRFPDLPLHPDGVAPESSLQVYFIVSMRFAFITLRFLEFLDTHGHASEDQITELVLELKSVVAEWDLERSFRAAVNPTDTYLYADLLFSSHLLIISFQQSTKTSYPLQQIPEASLDAARQSIYILEHWSKLPTGNPYNTISLVSSYPVIHIFILQSNILSNPDTTTAEADLSLTLCFGTMLRKWSEERNQVGAHLAFVVNVLNEVCRHVVCVKSLSTTRQ